METAIEFNNIDKELKALLNTPFEEKILETGEYIAKNFFINNTTISIQYDTYIKLFHCYIVKGNYSNNIKLIAPFKKRLFDKRYCFDKKKNKWIEIEGMKLKKPYRTSKELANHLFSFLAQQS